MRFPDALRIGVAVAGARVLGRRVPFFVTLCVTNRCNQRCTYCGFPLRDQQELTTGQIGEIIDGLARLGTRRIVLLGGEPMLREDIGALIGHCGKRRILCAMTSNGSFISERIAELRGLEQLDLSLDGGRQAHDRNRGQGSFDRVIRAAEAARAAKIPLQFCAMLTPESIGELDELMRLARHYRCMVAVDFPYRPQGLSPEANYVEVDAAVYRDAVGRIIALKRRGEPVLFSVKAYQAGLDRPFKGPRCLAGRSFGFIDTNADLYPCVSAVGREKALNCLRDGVKAAWDFAGRHSCSECIVRCQVEMNYLFALDLGVIASMVRNIRKRG